MGKSIQPQPLKVFPKKGIAIARKNVHSTKKSDAINLLRKKPDVIESYLRTLSNNFGTNDINNINGAKRKLEEGNEDEMPITKKQKLDEKDSEEDSSQIYNTEKFEYLTTYLEYNDEVKDLFHIDDAKCSDEHSYYVDWLHQLCEEISLEGLDGITVEALWSRMKYSSHPALIEGKEEIFWNLLKYISQIEFYILDQPRGNLMIYDKNNYVCPETGIVLEPMIDYGEIYPYSMVNRNGIRGSCDNYDTRMENSAVIRKLGLKEALNVYGNRLVLVASQKMREHAIMSEIADPMIELMDNEYGLLERVGRARSFGELTQGKVSVLNMIKDSRSIFHVRKSLEGKKLLKKQFFLLRNASSGQNKTGKLLHLPRFYRLQKNKTLLLIEEIVELLRQKPGYSLDFGEFRKYFPRSTGVNKILKIPEFTKYIKTDIFRPYRVLYPNAKVEEWKYKNRNKEKILRIFQLIDPTINVAATWNNADNEDMLEDEQAEEDIQGSKLMDLEFSKEVFSAIFKRGKQGITLQELVKILNFDYYTIRIALRKLQSKNVIDTLRTEQGKQRHIYYFSRCFHSKTVAEPVRRTRKIPQNLLQKILRGKNTSKNTLQNNSSIVINVQKTLRNTCLNYPLRCSALVRENTAQDPISVKEHAVDPRTWTIPLNRINVLLPDIRIIPKLCNVISGPRKKNYTFAELKNIITSYSSYNIAIKVILLKSSLMGVHIDVQNILSENISDNCDNFVLDSELTANARKHICTNNFSHRDFLLGPNPVRLSQERTTESIEIIITQSTPPETYIYEYQTYVSFDKNVTAVSLARSNMILGEVNKSMIIVDIYKLQKAITDMEMELTEKKREGQGKMDKNTLHRILVRLINEGYIKIFKLFLLSREKYKTQWIVAHPSVDLTHPLLVSTKEQALVKFFLGMDRRSMTCVEKSSAKKSSKPSSVVIEDATSSVQTLELVSTKKSTIVYKQNRLYGRILGYQPKFVRMQLFHELLYYLIYDFEPLDQMSRSDMELINQHYHSEELHEIPPIYRKTIDWKMFIPPLPVHKNFSYGWTLLCDVILSIPLSLWVKLFHISIECPKLVAYMEHPIRQHYLIKDIPIEFRHILMHKRKYLFNAVELVYRLCFIGLVQLGPQSSVIKDQIFLYLNRKASFLDTSSSGPSYHKITSQKYKEISFTFLSSSDVDNYWCQLWTISMNTPLGQRRIMEGKSVTIESASYKTMLLDTLKAKTPEEALANDDGHIPGDKMGAGGLDSSMWFHIKRNWLWSSKIPKCKKTVGKENQGLRSASIACIKPVAIKYKELMNSSRKIYMTDANNSTKCVHNATYPKMRKRTKVTHIIKARKNATKIKKGELDAKDKAIIKKVGKTFRAKFNKNEDKILYICKAANYFLTKNHNIYKASRFLIRDILHILVPESHNKTSGACARRLAKLERSDIFLKKLQERAYELISLKELSTHFAPIIFNLNKSVLSSMYSPYNTMDKNIVFVHAVWYIHQNYNVVWKILQGHSNNLDYFSSNNIETFGTLVVNIENRKSVFSVPSNQGDIEKDAIKSVLISALNCSQLGENISYQFYQICKKYSDSSIRAAISTSKGYQAISVSKKTRPNGNTIRAIPFQLSITYTHMQKSTFSCQTVQTIYQYFLKILKENPRFSVADTISLCNYGQMLARNELATVCRDQRITMNIPESAHALCPSIENQSVLITKLAELYRKYLKDRVQDIENPLKKPKRINDRITMNIIQPIAGLKRFALLKSNIKRLLSNLPCYYNETIGTNLSLFLECKDEDQINKFLEIFLHQLIKITMNLFTSEPGGRKLLQSYSSRFYRPKSVDSINKDLERKISKLCFAIRGYLRSHDLTESIECFGNELLRKDNDIEEIIHTWLDKTKVISTPLNNEEKAFPEQKKTSCFFKFNMNKPVDSVKVITNINDVPEVEEIKTGMLETSTSFKRSIPHISDVVCLLSQDRSPNADDEKMLEELRENFSIEYPTLEKFEIANLSEFEEAFKYLSQERDIPDVGSIIYRYCHIEESSTIKVIEKIKQKGGNTSDHLLAGEIIGYVFNLKVLGATGTQIMTTFKLKESNLDLHVIVEILCDCFILLEVGITEKTFVHIDHGEPWLVETFHLSPHENHLLHASVNDELQKLQHSIESRIHSSKPVTVIMMPWLHLDGTLNSSLLNKWLAIVLSFCLERPNCPLHEVFEKFYLVKPTELFLLLKILQELKCLRLMIAENQLEDLWSDVVCSENRPANILDSFTNMFIDVQPLATISLGKFLNEEIDNV